MTGKKKKIVILTVMVALLVLTGVLNIVLNNTVGNATNVSGENTYVDFFTSYRDYRTESREQSLLYYDEIIASESSSAEAKAEAENAKMELTERMETELVLEGLIRSLGFEDAIVTNTTENLNVIVKCDELTGTQMTQIKEIVVSETGVSTLNLRIIPTK